MAASLGQRTDPEEGNVKVKKGDLENLLSITAVKCATLGPDPERMTRNEYHARLIGQRDLLMRLLGQT